MVAWSFELRYPLDFVIKDHSMGSTALQTAILEIISIDIK